jgi:hypothetical protein
LAIFVLRSKLVGVFPKWGVDMELAALIVVLVLAGAMIPGDSKVLYYR